MEQSDITLLSVQKTLKPKIEAVLPYLLDGGMLEAATGFVAYMRANKMQPTWQSTNTWKANHKGHHVCTIRLSEGSWSVVPRISRWNKLISSYSLYEKEIREEGLQDIVLANVRPCVSCASCGPGWKMDILGNEYDNVCHNVPVRYENPDETEINCVKRILDLMKRTVAENM